MPAFRDPRINLYLADVGGGRPSGEVCVWTGDVDAAYEFLVAHGALSDGTPHDFLNGRLRAAWVADPAGNPLEIVMQRHG